MSTNIKDLQARLILTNSKLKRKDEENKRLKAIITNLLAKNDSEDLSQDEDSAEESIQNSEDGEDDEDDEDEITGDEQTDDDAPPEPIQSLEFEDVYLCTNTACGGEVTDGVCHFCGKPHQVLEDEFSILASTESQLEHPDRDIAPRGDTPLKEIEEGIEIPADYASRIGEYKELLRRGATPEMCTLFSLVFIPHEGISAFIPPEIFNQFSGPAMNDDDVWQIYLGRRVRLEETDVDGREFVESLLDDISVLPDTGNWATEEESPGIWITYPKFRGELDICRPNMMDCRYASDDDADTPVYANDYDLSDDDSDQAELEGDDPAFFTTSGVTYNHLDRWYIHSDEDMSEDESDKENQDDDDSMKEDSERGDSSTISDSDLAGSDFDSDEVLTGDEEVLGYANP
ncbi:hypothetical protein JR316_0010575 [Psilocybe cubensis]|uniref:DUF8191 domain-containing protein n=3 Tax=Psilocybe cubensis TaxID=181762 RepID=A0A8H7XTS3_PSICU|nr:hypothetical protein JR316_0010447 [Psilocybe cubensis]XP_047744286.1 hypothetical protein JR316_0010575 [Psilocybe cubensis]KAH9476535.1 hypothetical protein JR316_0010447 [Psilocybe cubensis]KAH9476661.1 hypothetical protein JR316_0010575 [Psilocybe cubensis]